MTKSVSLCFSELVVYELEYEMMGETVVKGHQRCAVPTMLKLVLLILFFIHI